MFFQKKASSATARREAMPEKTAGLIREAWWLLLVVVGVYLATILMTYHRDDPGWSHSASEVGIHNAGGTLGAWLADILLFLFGFSAWWLVVLSFYAILWVYRRLETGRDSQRPVLLFHCIGFGMLLIASSALESGHLVRLNVELPLQEGGMLGEVLDGVLRAGLGYAGSSMLLLLTFAAGFSLFTGWSWLTIIEKFGAGIETGYLTSIQRWRDWQDRRAGRVRGRVAGRADDELLHPVVNIATDKRGGVERVEQLSERRQVDVDPPGLRRVRKCIRGHGDRTLARRKAEEA